MLKNRTQQGVSAAEVVDQHAGRGAAGAGQRLDPFWQAVCEGMVGAGADGPGLAEDVATVRQVLQDSEEPTVVVAHSYGGIVTAEAAAGVGSVRHLVLISSYLPEVGQSLHVTG
ncbi:MAG TPA: alpha/beta hydrolase [Jatrophihabitans sp.]